MRDNYIYIDPVLFQAGMWAVLFILASIVLVYIIIFLHNLNKGIRVLGRVLENNEKNLDSSVSYISDISKDILQVTGAVKEEITVPIKAIADIINFLTRLLTRKFDKQE